MTDLKERLREEALNLQQTAWSRMDGGQDCTLSATLADEAADQLEAKDDRIQALEDALRERDAELSQVRESLKVVTDSHAWVMQERKRLHNAADRLIVAVEFEVPAIRDGVRVDDRLSILMQSAREARALIGAKP